MRYRILKTGERIKKGDQYSCDTWEDTANYTPGCYFGIVGKNGRTYRRPLKKKVVAKPAHNSRVTARKPRPKSARRTS